MHSHTYMKTFAFLRENPCLNPCFNGRCTRTALGGFLILAYYNVLILVLMEDALAPKLTSVMIGQVKVLILVLMEDALAR